MSSMALFTTEDTGDPMSSVSTVVVRSQKCGRNSNLHS
jgi:hypothetical protein